MHLFAACNKFIAFAIGQMFNKTLWAIPDGYHTWLILIYYDFLVYQIVNIVLMNIITASGILSCFLTGEI